MTDDQNQTRPHDLLTFAILDALRFDAESVATLMQLLNLVPESAGWRRNRVPDFTRDELVACLLDMIGRKLVAVSRVERVGDHRRLVPFTVHRGADLREAMDVSDMEVGGLWFRPSEDGTKRWNEWGGNELRSV